MSNSLAPRHEWWCIRVPPGSRGVAACEEACGRGVWVRCVGWAWRQRAGDRVSETEGVFERCVRFKQEQAQPSQRLSAPARLRLPALPLLSSCLLRLCPSEREAPSPTLHTPVCPSRARLHGNASKRPQRAATCAGRWWWVGRKEGWVIANLCRMTLIRRLWRLRVRLRARIASTGLAGLRRYQGEGSRVDGLANGGQHKH